MPVRILGTPIVQAVNNYLVGGLKRVGYLELFIKSLFSPGLFKVNTHTKSKSKNGSA